jgi:peptidoglycan/LPS O-acetylase OafA/YrhL
MPVVAGYILIAAFLVTALSRRAHRETALLIGSLPALIIAAANPANLGHPMGWLYVAAIGAPFLIFALLGAWLGRLVHSGWRRA